MRPIYGLDLETFSSVNLKVHGLDRYVNSPDFTILIASISYESHNTTFDLVFHPERRQGLIDRIMGMVRDGLVSAHNVGFERAATRIHLELDEFTVQQFIDSAAIARIHGAASSLASASRQLLDSTHKLDTGTDLIQLFCVPNEWNGGEAPTKALIEADPEIKQKWLDFIEYCEIDAQASREITEKFHPDNWQSTAREIRYEKLTALQNETGWNVDMASVREMNVRYHENVDYAKAEFRVKYDPKKELNFASPLQLKEWAKARGIRASGFDQEKVELLLEKLQAKVNSISADDPHWVPYNQVLAMLKTKQVIGGSSLKKLKTIIDTVGPDDRLRNQYMHVGAGQTYRTSGRGVQMQNLKRLDEDLLDMDLLMDPTVEVNNDVMGANLRQVFTASHPQGELIVGDFSSVESRGLAWLAGADWKIDAYRQGQDLYKVLAGKLYNKAYEDVTKQDRKMGKLGELSCGYGAGKGALKRIADRQKLGLDEDGVQNVVTGWRDINPEVTTLWNHLHEGLLSSVQGSSRVQIPLANDLMLSLFHLETPATLLAMHPNAQSIGLRLYYMNPVRHRREEVMERVFHGCYMRGQNVAYYKPTERKTGDLWSSHFVDPITKQIRFYEVYGGKLAGILTQSMCRELFFYALDDLYVSIQGYANVKMVGQFHDEIVVDWTPRKPGLVKPQLDLDDAIDLMSYAMSTPPYWAAGFPLAAEIKSAYRYIK